MLKTIITMIVGMLPAPTAAAQEATTSAWKVDEAVTPLTGAKSVSAVLQSTKPLTNMIGQPQNAALVLRCEDRVLAAYVVWPQVAQISGTSITGGYQTMVLWKVDQNAIAVNFWDRSDDGAAAGKFTTSGSSKLIAKLVPAHQLVVRMTGTTTQDAVFDLDDVNTIATRVGAACGVSWSIKK